MVAGADPEEAAKLSISRRVFDEVAKVVEKNIAEKEARWQEMLSLLQAEVQRQQNNGAQMQSMMAKQQQKMEETNKLSLANLEKSADSYQVHVNDLTSLNKQLGAQIVMLEEQIMVLDQQDKDLAPAGDGQMDLDSQIMKLRKDVQDAEAGLGRVFSPRKAAGDTRHGAVSE